MFQPTSAIAESRAELLGKLHPLTERLGSAEGLATLTGLSGQFPRVCSLPTLSKFLQAYSADILVPIELPAIYQSFLHASRNELRELLSLDYRLREQMTLRELALASQAVGKTQLKRLRPLRDQRFVQRYLQAVEKGDARGWHTLVYGLILYLYSLPVRQGLAGYSLQTLRGFVRSASRPLLLDETQCKKLLDEFCAGLNQSIEAILAPASKAKPHLR